MILQKDLRELAAKRLKDSYVLLNNRRYLGSKYLGGYVIELLLKLNICKFYKLKRGLPETKKDFNLYKKGIKETLSWVLNDINVKTFKIHDLEKLLQISGRVQEIKDLHLEEWTEVLSWKPDIRYCNKKITKNKIFKFYKSINIIQKTLNQKL